MRLPVVSYNEKARHGEASREEEKERNMKRQML